MTCCFFFFTITDVGLTMIKLSIAFNKFTRDDVKTFLLISFGTPSLVMITATNEISTVNLKVFVFFPSKCGFSMKK